jgi:hypothetical protein
LSADPDNPIGATPSARPAPPAFDIGGVIQCAFDAFHAKPAKVRASVAWIDWVLHAAQLPAHLLVPGSCP